jgi:antitoxin CptB
MNKLEVLKKKIKYRASYRGTKEMDMLLTSFVNTVIDELEFVELIKLDEFLNINDEDIYSYYFNNVPISIYSDNKILSLFKKFKI